MADFSIYPNLPAGSLPEGRIGGEKIVVNLASRFGIIILLLFRPTIIFAFFCFVAGGVTTIKSAYVHEKMEIFAVAWDQAIQPEIERGKQEVNELLKQATDH